MDTEQKIIGRECRFAIHMPSKSSNGDDLHLVKEIQHFEDGTIKPNLVLRKNYKRNFWVTKKQFRNHQQKKEYEHVDKLIKYESTQSDLRAKVAKAFDKAWSNARLEEFCKEPYLYGTDISSTSLIKNDYAVSYPDYKTDYSVCFFDIETDVVHKTDDPNIITSVFKDRIYTCVMRSFLDGYSDPVKRLYEVANKHLKEYIEKYDFKIEFEVCDTVPELIKKSIAKVHEWSPDFLAIWNISFDIGRILETLDKYNVDAKDIFSDPRIPPELRFCKFKKGSTKKVTASGQVKPKAPSEQWHTLYCPAGFYVIDAMSSYRFIRQGEQELPYYKLDYVLEHELGIRKLRFSEADHLDSTTLDWHEFMQARHPFEYVAYNIFDCIGMLELETKNLDLAQKLPVQCDVTDFSRFNSQTKRFADDYYLFLLPEGKIAATVPPRDKKKEEEELDVDAEEPPSPDDDEENGGFGVPEDYEEKIVEAEQNLDTLPIRGWIN